MVEPNVLMDELRARARELAELARTEDLGERGDISTALLGPTRDADFRLVARKPGVLAGVCIADSQCGFRLLKREVVQGIDLRLGHFDLESEMLVEAARRHFSIKEVPIATIYNDAVSHINPWVDTGRFILFVLRMLVRR